MADVDVRLTVNGRPERLRVPARTTLADALRDRLGLTGTHLGCEHGVCGACTVLVSRRTVRSCITLAAQVEGRDVTTIEGVASDGQLTPLQAALAAEGGLQCGFCTPGFVLAATELLAEEPSPDESMVRDALSGNLCRCTGYEGIVRAVLSQARAAEPARTDWPDLGPPPGAEADTAPPVGAPRDRRPGWCKPSAATVDREVAGIPPHQGQGGRGRLATALGAALAVAAGLVWAARRRRGRR